MESFRIWFEGPYAKVIALRTAFPAPSSSTLLPWDTHVEAPPSEEIQRQKPPLPFFFLCVGVTMGGGTFRSAFAFCLGRGAGARANDRAEGGAQGAEKTGPGCAASLKLISWESRQAGSGFGGLSVQKAGACTSGSRRGVAITSGELTMSQAYSLSYVVFPQTVYR